MKYRKKPIVIEASVWREKGDHPEVGHYRRPDDPNNRQCEKCGHIMHRHGWIDTLEGGHIVCPNDWIIEGVKGEFYPCKPDIFEMTYEPAVHQTVNKIRDNLVGSNRGR